MFSIALWFFGLVGIIAFWSLVAKKLFNDILCPFMLLLPAWIFPIYYSLLNISDFDIAWSLDVWISVIVCTVILTGVSITFPKVFIKNNPIAELNKYPKEPLISLNVLIATAIGLGLLIYNDLVTNPLGLVLITFIKNPDISRDDAWHWTGDGLFENLSAFSYGIFPIACAAVLKANKTIINILTKTLLIVYPVVEILKASRLEIVMFVFSFFVIYHYKSAKILNVLLRNLKLLFGFVALISLMAYLSAETFHLVRSSKNVGEMSEQLGIHLDVPSGVGGIIAETYTYLATPFQNHARFIVGRSNSDNDLSGVGLGKLVLPNFLFKNVARNQFAILNLESYLTSFANTYPCVTFMYAEGGIGAVALETTVFSVFICWMYVNMVNRYSVINIALYSIAVSRIWIWIFCSNNFAGLQYYLSMVACVILYHALRFSGLQLR
jgi:hypothetical protein